MHSHYSLLEALPKIPNLVKYAVKNKMPALALTDSGNLYGAIEFYQECTKAGIKPIIGVDFYVASRTRHDKEARIDDHRARLVLLAENEEGYKNLLKLVSASHLEGFYYKPRIDRELLEKYQTGLIAIAKEEKYYKEIFGENFFLEESLAIYDVRYLEPEDRPALNTMLSIQEHLNRGAFDEEEDLYFRTQKEAEKDFTTDALENTAKIAERCNLKIDLGKWIFPDIDIADGMTPDEAFKKLAYEGLDKKGLEKTKEVTDRVEYELKVIKDKGFSKYLIIVSDLLHYAHEHGILTNVRGSVAGSLVSYLTGITNINPLEYKLPFERFLNPDRPSPPDIDLDIADNRRDELIEYSRKKYGEDHVAQICTFGTMMARGSVRDTARALGYPYTLGDRIAKLIPLGAQGFPMTIDRAMKENPELKKLYEEDKDSKTIIDMAKKIEGCARHVSVHAAGVVIAPGPLTDYTPLQFDTKGEHKIITQYDMYSLDPNAGGDMTVGLLKFDFLGIKNLSIISDTFERIKKIENKVIEMDKIPLDDQKTFEMLSRGETEGTFQ
ncbi:MAG: PHP domain-containing protein [bacterium]|nr:PHP domain-containing protein [bacterium]